MVRVAFYGRSNGEYSHSYPSELHGSLGKHWTQHFQISYCCPARVVITIQEHSGRGDTFDLTALKDL